MTVTALGLPEPALQRAQKVLNDRNAPLFGWDEISDAALQDLKAGVLDATQARRRIEEGWQFIVVASEAGFMLGKAGEVAKALGLGTGQVAAKY